MRIVLRLLGLLGAACASVHVALAQDYPTRPVQLVVPFAAGSGTDSVARIMSQKLSARLKQAVVVQNKPGALGQIAAEFVAKSVPDGYTLFMTTNTSHSANPSLFKKLSYDPIKDFTPIARGGEMAFVLTVNPKLPVNSVNELFEYAKRHPGKLSYANTGSVSLVASELLKKRGTLNIIGVPYKASPQAVMDLTSGEIQIYVVDLGAGQEMIKSV